MTGYIENEAAYERAIARRIAANREKGRLARLPATMKAYLAQPGKPEVIAALRAAVARNANRRPGFLEALLHGFEQWGSLTEKQEAAILTAIARDEERAAARLIENAALAATSNYVGKLKERLTMRVTLERRWEMDGFYGPCDGHIFADAAGNRLVAIGSPVAMEVGETRTIKATVKGHEERDGIKQTKVNRVAVQEELPAEDAFLAARFTQGTKGITLS